MAPFMSKLSSFTLCRYLNSGITGYICVIISTQAWHFSTVTLDQSVQWVAGLFLEVIPTVGY